MQAIINGNIGHMIHKYLVKLKTTMCIKILLLLKKKKERKKKNEGRLILCRYQK